MRAVVTGVLLASLALCPPAQAAVGVSGGGTSWVLDDDGTSETITIEGIGGISPGWRFKVSVAVFSIPPAGCDRTDANKTMTCSQGVARIDVNANAGNDKVTVITGLGGLLAPVVLDGGVGDDELTAGSLDDTLTGGDGIDTLDGRGGEDIISGGPGNDILIGGVDNDLINGGADDDVIDGDDTLSATADGDDTINGDAGKDTIDARGGSDKINAGDGDDTVTPGAGSDGQVRGGPGVDQIRYDEAGRTSGVTVDLADTGGDASEAALEFESVFGSVFADVLRGTDAVNKLSGDDGDDVLDGRGGADELTGGAGVDTVSYADRAVPIVADLANDAGDGAAGEGDLIRQVDHLIGGSAGDQLTGDGVANTLEGGAGDDKLLAGGGNDLLIGGDGVDSFAGDAGNDELRAQDGLAEQLDCGADEDTVSADAIDVLIGCEHSGAAPAPSPTPTPTPAAPVLRRLATTLSLSARVRGGRTRITALTLRTLPAGAKVTLRCTLPRRYRRARPSPCAFTRSTLTITKATATLKLAARFKQRRLPAGTAVTIAITAPQTIGRTTTLTTRKTRKPARRTTCADAGGKRVTC